MNPQLLNRGITELGHVGATANMSCPYADMEFKGIDAHGIDAGSCDSMWGTWAGQTESCVENT
jgi:hypothetical protein